MYPFMHLATSPSEPDFSIKLMRIIAKRVAEELVRNMKLDFSQCRLIRRAIRYLISVGILRTMREWKPCRIVNHHEGSLYFVLIKVLELYIHAPPCTSTPTCLPAVPDRPRLFPFDGSPVPRKSCSSECFFCFLQFRYEKNAGKQRKEFPFRECSSSQAAESVPDYIERWPSFARLPAQENYCTLLYLLYHM